MFCQQTLRVSGGGLPSESISDHSAREPAQHSSDGEDADGDGVELVHRVFLDVLAVAILVHVLHEILYVLFWNIVRCEFSLRSILLGYAKYGTFLCRKGM